MTNYIKNGFIITDYDVEYEEKIFKKVAIFDKDTNRTYYCSLNNYEGNIRKYTDAKIELLSRTIDEKQKYYVVGIDYDGVNS